MTKEHQRCMMHLQNELNNIYAIARKAREKGLDPAFQPEAEIAHDLAELVEGLVGPSGVAHEIRELNKRLSREELAFEIAKKIVNGGFGHQDSYEAADQAIRTSLAILTEGITAAPLQGVTRVAIKSNFDKTKYLAIYFAGPIRSAGGTEQALTLVIGDFIRRLLGLERYKPTEKEIRRFVEEVRLFERSVSRFQYRVSDEELRKAVENIPVEVTGTETNSIEVSSFRDLSRIETNRIRGGALRVVNDGIVGRSAKVWSIIEKLGINGWDWLRQIREIEQKKKAGFMEDIIAGRPIFSFPSKRGGFRLRYGRARNTGLAAVGIHPATMMVLQNFLATGTQLRIEGPGKAGIVVPVDTLEPPIVKLKDGSVISVTLQNYKKINGLIESILYLGDILVSFGDFLYNNKPLLPAAFTEEWWCEELLVEIMRSFHDSVEDAAKAAKIPESRFRLFLNNPFETKPTGKEAISLALIFGIPLHPLFTYFWSNLSSNELSALRRWLLRSVVQIKDKVVHEITGSPDESVKRILEKLCIPHRICKGRVKIVNDEAYVLAFCLGLNNTKKCEIRSKCVFDIVYELSGIKLREKAPTFLGARMGRPEKAKRREMKPLVHVLFPVGLAGGSRRNLVVAMNSVAVKVDLVRRRCSRCGEKQFKIRCPKCDLETHLEMFCPRCAKTSKERFCPRCKIQTRSYETQSIDLKLLMDDACQTLNLPIPPLVKGVKGLSNETKTAEILEKGILRAKHDLSVFKDGTIRFDATNAPLTHFKPIEIDVQIEKLRELGYKWDQDGNPLIDPHQICELKIQDIIIPVKCGEYFVRLVSFIDELLERVYDLPRYYNVKCVSDLTGHLTVGLAPHTSVGILGRIIGFVDVSVCYAHPLWHSAKRRDCDGDEDTLMLALDLFLNFSKVYLPAQIGGIMDAPLFVIPSVNPQEVQRQAHEVDVARGYPLIFYETTMKNVAPRKISELIDTIGHRIKTEADFEGFSYTTLVSNINLGNHESSYKKFNRMTDKLASQLSLAEKIDAVDAELVALKVLTRHFIRDIVGNLRAFTNQSFRCKECNKRFRRVPLRGNCIKCEGALTLTVHRGGIEKYLEAAHQLVKNYGLPDYYTQQLELVEDEIRSLFDGKNPRQVTLHEFMV